MLISILQGSAIKEKGRFQELLLKNKIKIGTVLKVPPAIPKFNHFFHHYIMVYDVSFNKLKIVHLKKNLIKNECKVVIVPFDQMERYINFNAGVFIHSHVADDYNIEDMYYRVEHILNRQLPYALKNKFSYNCESLLYYLLLGYKVESSEVKRFEERFSKFGPIFVSWFDKIMVLSNVLGEFQYFMQTERKNNK